MFIKKHEPLRANSILFTAVLLAVPCEILNDALTEQESTSRTKIRPRPFPVKI